MAKSNLLKDAIADAKAVRETAIANAKIALEEAFTPRLQSILSQKLQQEIEGEEEDEEEVEDFGTEGDEVSVDADEEVEDFDGEEEGEEPAEEDFESEEEETDDEIEEGEGSDEDGDGVVDDPTGATVTEEDDEEGEDEDSFEDEIEEDEDYDEEDEESYEDESEEEEEEFEDEESDDDDIDLDEILREMGYGEDGEEEEVETDVVEELAVKDAELQEAYNVIRSLKGTINEVNLLNAKLLYSNKLFRGYDMTNEQKMKVIETLDRTKTVREVKLVFATLAESMKFGSNKRKGSRKITESFASDVVKSTAPKKEVITESNEIAERFKKLANIKG